MSRPKYCSWDVKELANDYGWTEILENTSDDSSVLKFYSKIHRGITVEISVTTGYVSSSIQHPSRGRTRLNCGERVTYEELEEVFESPRCQFLSSCKTSSILPDEGVTHGDFEDCEVSVSEERKENSSPGLKCSSSRVEAYTYPIDRDDVYDGVLLLDRLIKDWDSEEKAEIVRDNSHIPLERANDFIHYSEPVLNELSVSPGSD